MANLDKDLTILLHMKKYTEEITNLDLSNLSYDDFVDNYVLRNSISMDIMQIGELTNHLSSEYIEETKDNVNWNAIRGMRNHFAHGYFSMDYQVILNTAKDNIPELQNFLKDEIKRLSDNNKS